MGFEILGCCPTVALPNLANVMQCWNLLVCGTVRVSHSEEIQVSLATLHMKYHETGVRVVAVSMRSKFQAHTYIYIYTLFVFIEETRRKVMFAVRFRVGNPQKVRELSLEFLRL